ncbi:MAG: S8 family serine peptidase [Planctomycetia bacterium]|nr:S8 family serine peptidase [Planctomycetia bacterium]
MKSLFCLKNVCLLVILTLWTGATLWGQSTVPTTYDDYLTAINAPAAWEMGYTGAGVTVGIVDDSMETSHSFFNDSNGNSRVISELNKNYTNYSGSGWDDDNPNPYYDNYSVGGYYYYGDTHGTSVAGCVAAYDTTTNTYGPAYGASLAGIRIDLTCGSQRFIDLANAWLTGTGSIDIKNNSYGASTGYMTSNSNILASYLNVSMDVATKAGTIFAFAAGNERDDTYANGKDCNKKVYGAYHNTLTVAATGVLTGGTYDYEKIASFSCYGASVFISAPGDGIQTSDRSDTSTGKVPDGASTIDVGFQGYTSGTVDYSFDGTSAATPIVSGVMALAVEAIEKTNPYGVTADTRLMKHLLVQTAKKIDTSATGDEIEWTTNAAGNMFSPSYGFGLIDAGALVSAAETTFGVTEQTILTADWTISSWSSTEINPATLENIRSTDSDAIYYVYDSTYTPESSGSSATTCLLDASLSMGNSEIADENNYVINASTFDVKNVTVDNTSLTGESLYNKGSVQVTLTEDDFIVDNIDVTQTLEEVAMTVAIYATSLEDLRLTLVSAEGTESILAYEDPDGDSQSGLIAWTYTTNAFWGENPVGTWTLSIQSVSDQLIKLFTDSFASTFYMGALRNEPAAPEPGSWILFICFGSWLLVRIRRKTEPLID